MSAKTKGGRELEKNGFTVVKEVSLRWSGPGKWYEAITPDGEEVAMLKIGTAWHAFGGAEWSGSGYSPRQALTGGLGDVIGSDSQLRSYENNVLAAPERLLQKYDGLYRVSSDIYNQ